MAFIALRDGSSAARLGASRLAWGSVLPLSARGPVSAAIGRDDPAYRIRDLLAVNRAQRLSLRFTPAGATVRSGAGGVSLGLAGVGRSGRSSPVTLEAPRVSANRVQYGGYQPSSR
jgi:hypothetical protein